jgi:dCMP deaminase
VFGLSEGHGDPVTVDDARTLARDLAAQAACRRSKVGAVIVRDGQVVTSGRNGTAAGRSCLDGGCPRGLLGYDEAPLGVPSAGVAKCVGVHAEDAAILDAARRGVPLDGATIVVTKPPCRTCRVRLELAGIAEVIVA